MLFANRTAYHLNLSALSAVPIKLSKIKNPLNSIRLLFQPAAKTTKTRHSSASKTLLLYVPLSKIESASIVMVRAFSLSFLSGGAAQLSTLIKVGPGVMLGLALVLGSLVVSKQEFHGAFVI